MISSIYTGILNLPLKEPVFVFAVLILSILLAPIVFKIIRIPDIASYLLAGIIIGPYGFHLLERDTSIVLLGTVGLLYLMFVAGLELNLRDFNKSRNTSILFGLLTFIFPFLIGYIICHFILQLNIVATILVSIMFSTHTLVAYPIARKLGITKDGSVMAAVGGTIITDTLVLLVLSIITGISVKNNIPWEIIRLVGLFTIYLLVIFFSFPRLATWFFSNVKRDRPVHFIFLLGLVFISASIAKLVGVEPIIGAFVAGLALNKVIPKNSMLLQHVDFVGNILFIPLFLISIGMLIDLRILFQGIHLWYVAALLVISALLGKWLAAFTTQKISGYSKAQRNVLFGLTCSHAAATIAVILIGYEQNLIDNVIFNAVIVIILVTSLTASLVTEWGGKKLAKERITFQSLERKLTRRILVSIANPSTMSELVSLAIQMNTHNTEEPVYAVSVVKDDTEARSNLEYIRECLEMNLAPYNVLSEKIKIITRIDLNITNGILRAAKELSATDIVIGWAEKTNRVQKIMGNIFDHLLKSTITLYACYINDTVQNFGQINIFAPRNTEIEPSFSGCMNNITGLPAKKNIPISIYSDSELSVQSITKSFQEKKYKNLNHNILHDVSEMKAILSSQHSNTLTIFFVGRKHHISYDPTYEKKVKNIPFQFRDGNFILIVPGLEEIVKT